MSGRIASGSLMAALLLSSALAAQAQAAGNWVDRLPATDPAPATAAAAPPAAAAPAAAAPEESGGVLGALYGVVGTVASIPASFGQFWWEVQYMLGTNTTPVSRPVVKDEVVKMEATEEEEPATPAARPPAAKPVVAATQPAAPPPAAKPAEVAADDIDKGLLANFVYDRGQRQPDGSFFVPKTLQRLFKVRTEKAVLADVPVTMKLSGRIVPNPHTHGDVEASLMGRFEPPESGLPVLGDTVTRGQLLGFVVPAVGVVDRSQVLREVAHLTSDIRVEAENIEILKQFSFVPFREGKIYQAEQRLAGLRRQREALIPLLQTREALRAPTTGVISETSAVSGRMIHPGEMVYEIVNPHELWVEATAPDPASAAAAVRVKTATALTPEGQVLPLTFVGSGLSLKQQSTPVLFSIDEPPEGLRVGRPVTVTVQSDVQLRRGLPVPRDAVTIGTDGVEEVWEQTAPEVFVPHPVRMQDIDGATVLVVDGLKDGAHVVVRGSKLMAQLQ